MIYHKKRNTIYSDLSTVEKKAIMLRQHSAGEGSLRWEFGVSIPGLSSTRTRRKGMWQWRGQHSALNYLFFVNFVDSTASKVRGNGEEPLGMWGSMVGGQFFPPWAIDLMQSQSKSQQVILVLKFIWRGKWLRTANTILREKDKVGGLTLANLKIYYKASLIKPV